MDVITCPSCSQEIYAGAEVCPLCGERELHPAPTFTPGQIVFIAITAGSLLLLLGSMAIKMAQS